MDARTIIFINKNVNHVMIWNNDRLVFQQAHIYLSSDMNDLSPMQHCHKIYVEGKKSWNTLFTYNRKICGFTCLEDCTWKLKAFEGPLVKAW